MNCNCGDLRSVHRRQHEFLNECNRGSTTVSSTTATVNSHHKHNRGIDHRVEVELGKLFGPTHSLDHGNRPQHHEREIDDLHGLQNRGIDHLVKRNWGISMVQRTTEMSLCVKTGMSTIEELQLRN